MQIWFDRVPPNVNVNWVLRRANNTYPTFRITNSALHGDTVRDHYWNTKQKINEPDSVDADSIEVAKFKDGFYYVKDLAWDIRENADAESVLVHVDNFSPRVKETFPKNWSRFVPNKLGVIWCTFSEPMDTATLDTNNIKIKSLKPDSFNYNPLITNIMYTQVDSLRLYKLTLEVDSFRYNDTAQVRLLDSIKDLAGKSIDSTKQEIAYKWNFVADVLQVTDDTLDDMHPVVSKRKIAWTKRWPGSVWCGAIQLYDFDQGTIDTISPDWSYSYPVNYGDSVLCLRLNYPIYRVLPFMTVPLGLTL
ncbi:MAG TPA: hypothetical protein EYP58_01335 [bacterium (Candidatus Stahlbacteria)]|nr:hypothetical protein [Candidatus Stahlbacteria bacterium]